MAKRKMTDEKVAQAWKLRNSEGMSCPKIAAALGVSYSTVYYALNTRAREHNRLCMLEYYRTHRSQRQRSFAEYRRTHKREIRHYKAEYYTNEAHRECRQRYNTEYRKTHSEEWAARRVQRRALIAGATVGNFAEIVEIYRRAKEDPKVRCYLCGKLIPKGHRHVDHIVSLSKGGAHRPSNLAVACDKCNRNKGNKDLEELGMLL